jgi:pimeloyl-ACP methyl ester carboxylesterase
MPIQRFEFVMRNGEKAFYLKDGNGHYPCLIAGPGSFYLPMFSEALKSQITFFAFDDLFVCPKGATVNTAAIDQLGINEIVERYGDAIQDIKQRFNIERLGLAGASAAALLTFQIALRRQDVSFVLGIGVPFITLSSSFETTNQLFMSQGSPGRITVFGEDQSRYKSIQEGNFQSKLPDSNVINGRLTPNSDFIESSRALRTKMLYEYQQHELSILGYWRQNPIGLVNSPYMRMHFFGKILPQLNGQNMAEGILAKQLSLLLVYGKRDYITPCDPQILHKLRNDPYCEILTYQNCGHFPMVEVRHSFDNDLVKFFNQRVELASSATFLNQVGTFGQQGQRNGMEDDLSFEAVTFGANIATTTTTKGPSDNGGGV